MTTWNVWSYDERSDRWLVVREAVPMNDALEAAERMTATANKHGIPGAWQAAPTGQLPSLPAPTPCGGSTPSAAPCQLAAGHPGEHSP